LSLSALSILIAFAAAPGPAYAGEAPAPAPAPPFSLRTLDGRSIRLQDFRGKVVVLDFWATWCKPCVASMPHLSQMQQRYAGRGLVVVGVSMDDLGAADVRRFADDLGVKFRLAMADDRVLDAYGPIRALPTTYFIDRRGTVARRVVGYIDLETMESYIRELF
jgi:peroxiredoxin